MLVIFQEYSLRGKRFLSADAGPQIPIFELNKEKYSPEKTPYLDTFHTVIPGSDLAKILATTFVNVEFL